ncbi:hypothetical protein L6164_018040 [Bauhinia variegata]|uniref:Uncharacterized protein n=1 Tax=Bauhinia variegata TaxID=167791 RepID=A0ACB9NA22_BAUVA|nr:hypothetical protein L6164_018040 [Bauhinia variegata]
MEKESKVVKHFSHKHPLCPSEVKEDICSACEQELSGSAYECTKRKCEFLIHKSCFELPQEVEHKSHPEHALTLLHSPSHETGTIFWCDACDLFCPTFRYHCINCQFDLHVGCASLPEKMQREDHEHELDLLYSLPDKEEEYVMLFCNVCNGFLFQKKWLYYCQKCGYAVHLECATREEAAEEPQEEAAEESQEEEEGLEEKEDAEEPQEEEEEEAAEESQDEKEGLEEKEDAEEEEEEEGPEENETAEEPQVEEEEEEEKNEESQEEEADRECTDEEYLNQLICLNTVLSNNLSNQQHRQRTRMMRKMGLAPPTFFPYHM